MSQIAEKLGTNSNNARVYLGRLKEEGRVREASKIGREKVYALGSPARQAALATPDPAIQAENENLRAKLRFMNEFFKANHKYLAGNPEIKQYVRSHEEFDEVEKLCQA